MKLLPTEPIIVFAQDEDGHEFRKNVTLYETDTHRLIVNFGGPIEYYFADLLKYYPYQKSFCIDMMGRLHKGSGVTISPEQMNELIDKIRNPAGLAGD